MTPYDVKRTRQGLESSPSYRVVKKARQVITFSCVSRESFDWLFVDEREVE